MDEQFPSREPLLGSWLLQRQLCMVYAATGVGKSMFTLAAALAVAGGCEYLGWKAPEARRVLLVDGEMDIAELQERAKLLMQAMPELDTATARKNLMLLAQQDQPLEVAFPDLAEEEGRLEVISRARKHKAALVILDNFSTLATVEDENDAASFNPFIDLMRRLKQGGTSCILVHHTRKDGETYRGTSKIAVTFDTIIKLSHLDGIPSHGGTQFELDWDKFRRLRDGSSQPLRVKLEPGADGSPSIWNCEVSDKNRLKELVGLVQSLEYRTQLDLAAAIKVSGGQLHNLKRKAIAAGFITSEKWKQCLVDAKRLDEPDDPAGDF